MSAKLDALKSAFAKKENNVAANWKNFYQFWKMNEGQQATVRFLPDLDPENSLGFLVENLTHELVINGQKQHFACASMYGEDCPICAHSRAYYDAKDEVNGKKFYKKRSYIGQVVVIESPIEHDQQLLVKLIEFGPALFKQIQAGFQSGDLDEAPYEMKGGYNFRIRKTKSGEYANYSTSSFAPKQNDLSDEVIAQLKLHNLIEMRAKHQPREVLVNALNTATSAAAAAE